MPRFASRSIGFECVSGRSIIRNLLVRNDGTLPVQVRLLVGDDLRGLFAVEPARLRLEPGLEEQLQIKFSPDQPSTNPYTAHLSFVLDIGPAYKLELRGAVPEESTGSNAAATPDPLEDQRMHAFVEPQRPEPRVATQSDPRVAPQPQPFAAAQQPEQWRPFASAPPQRQPSEPRQPFAATQPPAPSEPPRQQSWQQPPVQQQQQPVQQQPPVQQQQPPVQQQQPPRRQPQQQHQLQPQPPRQQPKHYPAGRGARLQQEESDFAGDEQDDEETGGEEPARKAAGPPSATPGASDLSVLCSKPFVSWLGVKPGAQHPDRVMLRNKSSRALVLSARIADASSGMAFLNGQDQLTLRLEPGLNVVVDLVFQPVSLELVHTVLVLTGPECAFYVPLLGYAGRSRLLRVTAQAGGAELRADDQMFSLGSVDPTQPVPVVLTVTNDGDRAACVAVSLGNESRETVPNVRIEPDRFVLAAGATQRVHVRLALRNLEAGDPSRSALRKLPGYRQYLLAILNVAWVDNVMRELLTVSPNGQHPLWSSPVAGAGDGRELAADFVAPACFTAARLASTMTQHQRLGLLLDSPGAPSTSAGDHRKPKALNGHAATARGPFRASPPAPRMAGAAPPASTPPGAGQRAEGTKVSPARSDTTVVLDQPWAIYPDELQLTAPGGHGHLHLTNYTSRGLHFEFHGDVTAVHLDPPSGTLPPQSRLLVRVTPADRFPRERPEHADAARRSWHGHLTLVCDGRQEPVSLQIIRVR